MKQEKQEKQEKQPKQSLWLTDLKSTFLDSRSVQALGGLLVLQLIAAGGFLWQSNSEGEFAPSAELVSIDPATVDQIVIEGEEEGEKIALSLDDDQWRMDDEHNTLAAKDKIDELLKTLNELKPGLPVANTVASHAQLEVAEDQFKRRLIVKSNDQTVADLYLGTSPGFRKSHARTIDDDSVFAVKLNTFDVPADANDWLDNDLLSFSDIQSIKAADTEIALQDDNWSVIQPLSKVVSHEVDTAATDSLLGTLSALRVTGFADALEADEANEAAAEGDAPTAASDDSNAEEAVPKEELITHEITVVQADEPITLILKRKGGEATIERSDVKGLYKLPVTTFEALTPEALQQLLVEKSEDSDDAPSKTTQSETAN